MAIKKKKKVTKKTARSKKMAVKSKKSSSRSISVKKTKKTTKKTPAAQKKKLAKAKPIKRKSVKVVQKKKKEVLSKKVKSKELKPTKTQKAQTRKILELKKELEYLSKRNNEEILIKDVEGRRYCHDENCDQPAVTDIYCRYHYLAFWKYLQMKKKLLENKYLSHTIEELISLFGEGALHFVLRDLKNEKSFEMATKEMSFSAGKEKEEEGMGEAGF